MTPIPVLAAMNDVFETLKTRNEAAIVPGDCESCVPRNSSEETSVFAWHRYWQQQEHLGPATMWLNDSRPSTLSNVDSADPRTKRSCGISRPEADLSVLPAAARQHGLRQLQLQVVLLINLQNEAPLRSRRFDRPQLEPVSSTGLPKPKLASRN